MFIWDAGHNVVEVTKAAYDDCDAGEETEPTQGNALFNSQSTGVFYFVCGVGGHCQFGKQKAKITVSDNC